MINQILNIKNMSIKLREVQTLIRRALWSYYPKQWIKIMELKNFSPFPLVPEYLLNASLWLSFSRCDSSDYDDILRDVEDNTASKPALTKNLRNDNIPVGSATLRCFPVYLGGTDHSSGCSTTGAPRLNEMYRIHQNWLHNFHYS